MWISLPRPLIILLFPRNNLLSIQFITFPAVNFCNVLLYYTGLAASTELWTWAHFSRRPPNRHWCGAAGSRPFPSKNQINRTDASGLDQPSGRALKGSPSVAPGQSPLSHPSLDHYDLLLEPHLRQGLKNRAWPFSPVRHVSGRPLAMRKPSTAHRSRRAPPLKDSDYDHEINLVDHAAEAVTPQALSPEPGQQPEQPTDQRPASSTPSQPQPEEAAEQDLEAAQGSGEGPSSSQRAPAQHSPPRRSTSGTSSKGSKQASNKAASHESLAGNAALPELQLTGEHLHGRTRATARGRDPILSDTQQSLRRSLGHNVPIQMRTAHNAASQHPRPPSTSYTRMKEGACSVGFPCSPPRL